ncbi:MAG: GAF domain-containing protein [Chloroflexi bacterium]|nr:GAF domain-containing protein [Chloroflexota bacterium]
MPGGGLLGEQQRLERTIGRIRWGAVALLVLLGPQFPNLSAVAVFGLGVVVAAYNVGVLRASARAASVERHKRVTLAAFAADLAALSVAMLLFSVDPYWTTFFIGSLVITGGAFRFGASGAWSSAVVLSAGYIAISAFRSIAFALPFEPQRMAFHLSVFALTALLMDRVVRDAARIRAEREDLIGQLERRVAEDAAVGEALRVVARGPGRALVPAVLEASRAVFQFDRATVFMTDEVLGEYVVAHRVAPGAAPPTPRMRVGEGLVGAAFATGRPLLVRNVLEHPRYIRRSSDEEARSVILVPLSIGGRQVAALSLSRALPRAFSEVDLRLAQTVGGLIAQVIENERLFAEASEAKVLRDLDQLKDEFLAAVSHDLRTPLTVISGSLELLARQTGEAQPGAQRLISQAERHVQRLQRNVEDLLDLAQLQEARIELEREFLSAGEVLGEVATTHEPITAAKGQSITIQCEDGLPLVLVDRRRMQQVLGNLTQNASRYSPEGSAIELRAERAGDGVRFAVVDEGPGIPATERERVFDKFYRGERARGTTSGTGLGLAIAQTLVGLHGGRIWVEDAARGGARFVVEMPHEPAPVRAVG